MKTVPIDYNFTVCLTLLQESTVRIAQRERAEDTGVYVIKTNELRRGRVTSDRKVQESRMAGTHATMKLPETPDEWRKKMSPVITFP